MLMLVQLRFLLVNFCVYLYIYIGPVSTQDNQQQYIGWRQIH